LNLTWNFVETLRVRGGSQAPWKTLLNLINHQLLHPTKAKCSPAAAKSCFASPSEDVPESVQQGVQSVHSGCTVHTWKSPDPYPRFAECAQQRWRCFARAKSWRRYPPKSNSRPGALDNRRAWTIGTPRCLRGTPSFWTQSWSSCQPWVDLLLCLPPDDANHCPRLWLWSLNLWSHWNTPMGKAASVFQSLLHGAWYIQNNDWEIIG